MDKLKTSDPNIYNEFCNGNFCVKKLTFLCINWGRPYFKTS